MKKYFLRALFVLFLTAGYHAGFAQATASACPKKGTAECPRVKHCPKKGMADCPLVKAAEQAATGKKGTEKTASSELPPCCRKQKKA